MTSDWARMPYDVLEKISNRIENEVKGVNRIVYDITSKPPSTIEFDCKALMRRKLKNMGVMWHDQ